MLPRVWEDKLRVCGKEAESRSATAGPWSKLIGRPLFLKALETRFAVFPLEYPQVWFEVTAVGHVHNWLEKPFGPGQA